MTTSVLVETRVASPVRIGPRPRLLQVLEATSSGAARYVADLLLHIDTEAFDVSFAYSPVRADQRFWQDLELIQARGIRTFEIPMRRNIRPVSDGRALWQLCRLVKSEGFDLVHSHSSKAGFLGRLASKLARSRSIAVYSPHAMAVSISPIYGYLERFAGLFTDALLGVSRSEREEIEGYRLLSSSKLRHVTAGIDIPSYASYPQDPSFREELGIPKDALLIGSAGRLAYQKDPFTFLQAAAEIIGNGVPAYFLWAGDGELREKANSVARILGISDRVRFLGYCPDIRPFLGSLDVFMLTSRYESFGYVTCEAMAMGKPVVATNVSGSNELVVHGETGYLVGVGKPADCAIAVQMLNRSPQLRRSMGEAGRARAGKHFELRRMVKDIEQVYWELLLCPR